MSNDAKAILAVLAVPLIYFVAVLFSIWSAYVLTINWNWFVTPVVALAGMVLMIRSTFIGLKQDTPDEKTDFWGKMLHAVVLAVIGPLFVLLSGWILQLFL